MRGNAGFRNEATPLLPAEQASRRINTEYKQVMGVMEI